MGNLKLKHEVNQEVLQLLNTLKLVNTEAATSESFKNAEKEAKQILEDESVNDVITHTKSFLPTVRMSKAYTEAQQYLLPDGDNDKLLECINRICEAPLTADYGWYCEFEVCAHTLYSFVVKTQGTGHKISTVCIKKLFDLAEKLRVKQEAYFKEHPDLKSGLSIADKAITIIRLISELEPTAENINLATEYTFILAFGGADSPYTKTFNFLKRIEGDPGKFRNEAGDYTTEVYDQAVDSSFVKNDKGETEPGGPDKVDPALACFLFHSFVSIRNLVRDEDILEFFQDLFILAELLPDDKFADIETAVKNFTDYGNSGVMQCIVDGLNRLKFKYENFLETSESKDRQKLVDKVSEILKGLKDDPQMPAELKVFIRQREEEFATGKSIEGVKAIEVFKEVALIDPSYAEHKALQEIATYIIHDIYPSVKNAVIYSKAEVLKKKADEDIEAIIAVMSELLEKTPVDSKTGFNIITSLAKMSAYTKVVEQEIVYNTNKDLVKKSVEAIVKHIGEGENNQNTPTAKAAIEALFQIGLYFNADEEVKKDIVEKLKKLKEDHKNFQEKTDGYICVLSNDADLESIQIIKKNLTMALYDIEVNRAECKIDTQIKAIGDAIANALKDKDADDKEKKAKAIIGYETGFTAFAQIMESIDGIKKSKDDPTANKNFKKIYDKTVEIYGNANGLGLEAAFGPYFDIINGPENAHHLNFVVEALNAIVDKNKDYNTEAAQLMVKIFLRVGPARANSTRGMRFIEKLLEGEDTPEKRAILFNCLATFPLQKRGFQSDIQKRLTTLEGMYKAKNELVYEIMDAVYSFYRKNKQKAMVKDQEDGEHVWVSPEEDQARNEEGENLSNAQFLSDEAALILGNIINVQAQAKAKKLENDDNADVKEEDKIIKKATKYIHMIDGNICEDDYMEKIVVNGKVDTEKVYEDASLEEKKKIYNSLNSAEKVNSIISDLKYWNPVYSEEAHNDETDILNDVVKEIEKLCESDLASGDLGFAESVMTAITDIFMRPELADPEDALRLKIASIFVKIANKYPKAEVDPETHDIKKDEHNRADMIGSWIENQASFFMLQVKNRLLIDLKQKVLENIEEYMKSADFNSTKEANIIYDTLNELQVPAVRNMRHAGTGPNPAQYYFNVLGLAKKKFKEFKKAAWDYRRRPVGK